MMVWSIILAAAVLVIVPMLFGYTGCKILGTRYSVGCSYAVGYTAMLAIYEILYMIARRMGQEFDTAYLWFFIATGSAAVATAVVFFRDVKNKEVRLPVNRTGTYRFFLILLAFQAAILIFAMPALYGDDVTYITFVNDMRETRRFYPYQAYDILMEMGELSPKYEYTSYYPFAAVLCAFTGIHPLIICKSVLPVVYLVMSYGVWEDLSGYFLKDDRRVGIFLILLSVIQFFGAYSLYTVTKRLLMYAWNGKSLMATIFLPLILLLVWKWTENDNRNGIGFAFFLMIGCIATSAMSFGLCSIEVAIAGLSLTLVERKRKYLFYTCIMLIPEVVLLFMWFFKV